MNQARFIEANVFVRYWEDASLNGQTDTEGKVPLRHGEDWRPVIELATGRILAWPEGLEAQTCYKICDAGEYWLLDKARTRIAKWKRSYVPARFFDVAYDGIVSDYIVLKIGGDGLIAGWQPPYLEPEQWVLT
ncbi:hypothetical protein G3A43_07260 [Paraburkholderia aspalathi]|nr:hypothetical protein [Paraburkholderia aspalathi]MBK3780051.1 hypothetical protein [Paraburkholderia aspalathi]